MLFSGAEGLEKNLENAEQREAAEEHADDDHVKEKTMRDFINTLHYKNIVFQGMQVLCGETAGGGQRGMKTLLAVNLTDVCVCLAHTLPPQAPLSLSSSSPPLPMYLSCSL